MYERYDGKGFPTGIGGKDIPLGARMLAICDTYADLTQNPRNPFRKTLVAARGMQSPLAKYKGRSSIRTSSTFSTQPILGEDLKARLLANRSQALLVDADPEETTVLELRMIEQGFVVKTARSAEQALKVLAEGETDLVIGEMDLGPNDGLALLAAGRKEPWGKDLAWVIYTRRQERALAQKAFELGVLDYVNKPANADVLVAKLKAMLDQRANRTRLPRRERLAARDGAARHGASPLPRPKERRPGSVRPKEAGGIHFVEGSVVNALWAELRGEDAFFAMLNCATATSRSTRAYKATARHQQLERGPPPRGHAPHGRGSAERGPRMSACDRCADGPSAGERRERSRGFDGRLRAHGGRGRKAGARRPSTLEQIPAGHELRDERDGEPPLKAHDEEDCDRGAGVERDFDGRCGALLRRRGRDSLSQVRGGRQRQRDALPSRRDGGPAAPGHECLEGRRHRSSRCLHACNLTTPLTRLAPPRRGVLLTPRQ